MQHWNAAVIYYYHSLKALQTIKQNTVRGSWPNSELIQRDPNGFKYQRSLFENSLLLCQLIFRFGVKILCVNNSGSPEPCYVRSRAFRVGGTEEGGGRQVWTFIFVHNTSRLELKWARIWKMQQQQTYGKLFLQHYYIHICVINLRTVLLWQRFCNRNIKLLFYFLFLWNSRFSGLLRKCFSSKIVKFLSLYVEVVGKYSHIAEYALIKNLFYIELRMLTKSIRMLVRSSMSSNKVFFARELTSNTHQNRIPNDYINKTKWKGFNSYFQDILRIAVNLNLWLQIVKM